MPICNSSHVADHSAAIERIDRVGRSGVQFSRSASVWLHPARPGGGAVRFGRMPELMAIQRNRP